MCIYRALKNNDDAWRKDYLKGGPATSRLSHKNKNCRASLYDFCTKRLGFKYIFFFVNSRKRQIWRSSTTVQILASLRDVRLSSSSSRLYPALFSFFSRCSKDTHNTHTNTDTKTRARQRVVYRDVRRRKNTHTSVQQNTFFMMWFYSSVSPDGEFNPLKW